MIEAMGDVSRWKAAGPDGFPADAFRELPVLSSAATLIFNAVMISGVIPLPMLGKYIVPRDRPKKDPAHCAAKRQMSLINALAKAWG